MSEPQDEKILEKFHMDSQEYDLWCWAANALAVAKYYNKAIELTQCDVATKTISSPESSRDNVSAERRNIDCCANGDCNTAWRLRPALRVVRHHRSFKKKRGGIPWKDVVDEIMNERVICATIDWDITTTRGSVHFVTICGFTGNLAGVKYVWIYDPAPGMRLRQIEFDVFKLNYSCIDQRGGEWTETFFTKK